MKSLIAALMLVISFLMPAARGQAPAGWRGDGTGVSASTRPPLKWSRDTNVVWAAAMPARSNSQPIMVGERLFVCSEPFDLLCLSVRDGNILWRRSNAYRDVTDDQSWSRVEAELTAAAPLIQRLEKTRSHQLELNKKDSRSTKSKEELESLEQEIAGIEKLLAELPNAARYTLPKTQEQFNGFTTATPTSDGRHVWAVFGNRVVVCYDLDGRLVWSDVLSDNPQSMWGHSSSPLLVGDRLIVNIEHTVAFDAATGRRVWQTKYGQSWGSAVSTRIGSEQLILLANGRILRASDGKVLTRVPGLANASPVVQDGVAYFIDVRAEVHELPAALDAGAESLEVKTRWSIQLKGGDIFASPIIHNGLIYTVSTQKVMNVIDAETGEIVSTRRLTLGDEPVWPSLCLADKYLYVSSRDGTTLILEAGRQYQEVGRNQLEYFISTPVFHSNRMFVRTSHRLYCIGGS
jgi:outer membrane protein assembly factor BamB